LDDIFVRGWENFVGRTEGPMNFRFIFQPLVASFLAIRAGIRDAREGRPAFLWSAITNANSRADLLREGFKDISKVFVIALSLDLIYQLLVLRGIYLLELLFTGSILAIVPYILLRGPINRVARRAEKAK
jgi:hypothetical protein